MAQPCVSLRRLSRFPLLKFGRNQSLRTRHCWLPLSSRSLHTSRSLFQETKATSTPENEIGRAVREDWSKFSQFPTASTAPDFVEGKEVTVRGFLSAKRVKGSKLVFAEIQVDNGPVIQIRSTWEEENSPRHLASKALRAVPLYSPVSVTGTVDKLYRHQDGETSSKSPTGTTSFPGDVSRIELDLGTIQSLNDFPKDIIVSKGVQFPPTARHLQLRFSESLRPRLLARPKIGLALRNTLDQLGFTEVETPILFKSTPEGAREFIVPTRRPTLAYALPQSPQQYKQILMCSGIRGYYQFARCFRDEDLRADRQPEFTQLDLEMAFATGEDVMKAVESLVSQLPEALNAQFTLVEKDGDFYPVSKLAVKPNQKQKQWPSLSTPFLRLTYEEAMSRFGVDKPDLRIPFEIRRVDQVLPKEFIGKITGNLSQPIVDAFRFRPDPEKADLKELSKFIGEFMDSLPISLSKNPDGLPSPILYDSKKPLGGLSSLGFEGVDALTSGTHPGLEAFTDLEDGDILFFQVRANKPFEGGSTALGRLRSLFYAEAVNRGFLPRNMDFKFLWVTDFPMFTPDNETDPGQGGKAGFSATHHPFTAPLTEQDAESLVTDPLKARADHYDLVVNGVELGGGSRRIHLASMQEYVMREVLQMTDEGVSQFSHLIEALRAGCPPHAGFALGFDRLVAVFTHTESIRDVIAFPKSMKGEDLTVKSPGRITKEQLETYHLAFRGKK
ncbi:tRNA synthetases class II (D, K and N) domain containing protein [Naviculisporaceae sp. PSN 640]